MNLRRRASLLLLVAVLFSVASPAYADIEDADASNTQDGDNASDGGQSGSASSGDAVGGQVVGIVSSGDAEVDATNRSEDVDVTSGDATAQNTSMTFVGQGVSSSTAARQADITDVTALNLHEGDTTLTGVQFADAASGDAVGGQVVGVVTTAGGSATATLDNTSIDVDLVTGDAFVGNDVFASTLGLIEFVGAPLVAPPPEPEPEPEPTPTPEPEPTCTASAVAFLQEGYRFDIECDVPIQSFTISAESGDDFSFIDGPPDYTCAPPPGDISCTADADGAMQVSVFASSQGPNAAGEVFQITVNGDIDLEVTAT